MSERGSFVSEYIYCQKCLALIVDRFTSERGKSLCAEVIAGWEGSDLPIVAGKIGGSYAGEEVQTLLCRLNEIHTTLCHVVRFAVLADNGMSAFVLASPGGVQIVGYHLSDA